MADYTAPRGTYDVLPDDTPRWQYLESKFRQTCALYGYGELRTPTFEHTELFTRNLGETTDVVSKEMYTFESRGGRSLTLRPEGTAPAVRAYVQHNLGAQRPVAKLYYIGRIFRCERPQAGRYREHTQLGVEAIGSPDPALDAEVISLAVQFYSGVGIEEFELRLNSIGCPECRPAMRTALVEFASGKRQSLCPACVARLDQNPLRLLDCKEQVCKQAMDDAPRMTDKLCPDCARHFGEVRSYLDAMGIGYVIDPRLVRGFDYYTRTAFEFVSGRLGAQNAIGGGGRYDDLVREIGGPQAPAVGFGLGLDRLILTIEALGIDLPTAAGVSVFVAGMGDGGHREAAMMAASLRRAGLSADMDYSGRSLKSQMKLADRLGARFVVILGDDEIDRGEATLRDMRTSEQTVVALGDLVNYLRERQVSG